MPHLSKSHAKGACRPRPAPSLAAALLLLAGVPAAAQPDPAPAPDTAFANAESLERAALVEEVLARNPTLAAAQAARDEAQARVPQASAWEDPMVAYSLAPLSLGGSRVGQMVEVRQRLPWPGKRALAREVATAEADAARGELASARLQLALDAAQLHADYYVVHRALEVSAHHVDVLAELRRSAEAQYVVGRAAQAEALQADVMLAGMERERLGLQAQEEALRAQLNGLLHRAPGAPLPPPPGELPVPEGEPPTVEALVEEALARRPEVAAARARLGGSEAAVRLAQRERLPDLELMGQYSTMWPDPMHRFMAGVAVNVPLPGGRRDGMAEEARARQVRLRHEEEQAVVQVRTEVAQARARLVEARAALALFRTRLVPAARDQVASARAGFTSGRNGFQTVLDAENNLRGAELQLQSGLADVQRREAELLRALGRTPGKETL